MQRFGEKLKTLRLAHSLTLKELADQLGYSTHAYISEIEKGRKKPTTEFILKVARLFDISLDKLMRDEEDLITNQ